MNFFTVIFQDSSVIEHISIALSGLFIVNLGGKPNGLRKELGLIEKVLADICLRSMSIIKIASI